MNKLLSQFKKLSRIERRNYFLIALAVLIITSVVYYGPMATDGRSGSRLSAWCSETKDNIDYYTAQGLSCGLWKDGAFVNLNEIEPNVYCTLVCYDCATESTATTRSTLLCAADSNYKEFPASKTAYDTKTDTKDDTFILESVSSPESAYRNEPVSIAIKAKNTGTTSGTMKVQCSMLDPRVHTWLQSVQSLSTDNCVKGEPFTQTKIVTIGPGEIAKLEFKPLAPNTVGTYKIFCDAFERCWTKDGTTGSSSTISEKTILIKERLADDAVVDSDADLKDDSGEKGTTWGLNFENPFSDLTTWWANKNTVMKFLIVFGAVFVVALGSLFIMERKQS